ncbi:MAG: hypothetical protein ABL931_16375, partial [Usitatibacteraceae bacterium]
VNAFYLYDLDRPPTSGGAASSLPNLGIRVRYALASGLLTPREAEGAIVKGAFVSPWFTAVRYSLPNDPTWRKWWPHVLPLWADSLAAEPFRKVRVALKWK